MTPAGTPPRQPVHATTVARRCGAQWRGLMLMGPSGSGKSDLALRLIDAGWRLVADDYSLVWASAGRLYAMSPATIEGRIEARGLGIVRAHTRPMAQIAAVIACTAEPVERLPEPEVRVLDGVSVPLFRLNALHASAATLAARSLQTL
ncbi:HPr kinase/phosphorylase [Brevundimonas sp. PAMC22021]|uniref:HPr kinase/phosphorylase n=1 Tax=Brevundimonas sp. PAMC22021 TaxID=2861285 RepID=UPI001C63B5B0|nr:HPr kinase/phosphatase C-terminal domain-containing protein [Brevundimonas sp. PAMC22021]QYF86544.1 HPr kinase/phosphatase C-terminal domain-containing protein [Brevundimonas sp. PAMC22021]